jgi:tagatose 6-phosphate kinase
VILCVCPSPAIDVTYRVAELVPGATNRVDTVTHRPGGKGVNVARVLHRMGTDVELVLPLGGSAGDDLAADLSAAGVRFDAVTTHVATRRTVTVVDASSATVLSEPAAIGSWDTLVDRVQARADVADVIVISGSLPVDAPADALATLLAACRRPSIVDTSGPALAAAIAAGASFVKPNAEELAELTGERDPHTAANKLAQAHAVTVVVSLGHEGLLAVTREQTWQVRPERALDGNPTGAGDAAVAGLALGLSRGADLPDVLTEAVALAGAAVLHPYAGDIDLDDVRAQRRGVSVTRLDPRGAS